MSERSVLPQLNDRESTVALNSLVNEGMAFGTRFIKDANARNRYNRLIQSAVDEIKRDLSSGKLTHLQAAQKAHAARNHLMELVRETSSDVGRALATHLKYEGRAFQGLLDQQALRQYSKSFIDLTIDSQRQTVFLKVVESASTANRSVNHLTRILGKAGKALGVISVGIVIYSICESETKLKTAAQEGTSLGLSSLFSIAGGWAGMACGPGAFVCVPVGVFLGGLVGALGADFIFHWND